MSRKYWTAGVDKEKKMNVQELSRALAKSLADWLFEDEQYISRDFFEYEFRTHLEAFAFYAFSGEISFDEAVKAVGSFMVSAVWPDKPWVSKTKKVNTQKNKTPF